MCNYLNSEAAKQRKKLSRKGAILSIIVWVMNHFRKAFWIWISYDWFIGMNLISHCLIIVGLRDTTRELIWNYDCELLQVMGWGAVRGVTSPLSQQEFSIWCIMGVRAIPPRYFRPPHSSKQADTKKCDTNNYRLQPRTRQTIWFCFSCGPKYVFIE